MSTTKTGIEWTDRTWNPVRGCSRISEGCRNCYAERVAARFSDEGGPFHLFADRNKSGSKWTGKVELIESELEIPHHWRKPSKIFVNSMSDLFHEALPDKSIDRVMAFIALCRQHTFQVLTKRAERMHRYWSTEFVCNRIFEQMQALTPKAGVWSWGGQKEMFAHLWLGVSVEDQKTADERIPWLLRTPATKRFVSYEPALGSVDLSRHFAAGNLHWVIAGGESGPGARPAHPDWFRSVRDQCVEAGVPFFFKQWGEWAPAAHHGIEPKRVEHVWRDGVDVKGIPFGTSMYRVGKTKAGRLLDGMEWNQLPEVRR